MVSTWKYWLNIKNTMNLNVKYNGEMKFNDTNFNTEVPIRRIRCSWFRKRFIDNVLMRKNIYIQY